MSRGDYNPGSGSYGFVTKKCPECYTHLPLLSHRHRCDRWILLVCMVGIFQGLTPGQ
jgi:hypothetical protein